VAARLALALAFVLLAVPAAQPAAGGGPDPGLRVLTLHRDYTITGATAAELRTAMNRLRPRESGGKDFDARTDWWINWYYTYGRAGGSCTIAAANVRVRIVFTLPRWHPGRGAATALVEKWNRYMRALRRHESGHADHAVVNGRRILDGLRRLVPRPSCTELGRAANALGQSEIRRGNAWDVAYDRQTQHGARQGAVFP